MLTRVERTQVSNDLSDHVGFTLPVGTLITIVFVGDDRKELGSMPVDLTNISDQAAWVVDACLASRWRRAPSLLELLLERLVTQGGKGGLASILTRVKNKIDPNPDPFSTLWVLANQPFLDRLPLRTAAKRLVEEITHPILRVNGPSLSGKTYTTELLSFIMEEARSDLHVVPVELALGTAPSYEVEELAENLTLPMEKMDPIPQRSNSSYPNALMRWVVRGAIRNSGIWIFALDGFGQQNLKPEVMEFIRVFAQKIAVPEYAKRMRLVLLDFDQPLTGNWRARTVDDGLLLGAVSQSDIEDCLRAFNAKMQEVNQPGKMIDPADIDKVAAAMMTTANGSGLPSLYTELMTIATS